VVASGEFMSAHVNWPDVKRAVAEYVGQTLVCPPPVQAADGLKSVPLADQIREVARKVAENVNAPEPLLVGIVAVAFGSLQQVGLDLFRRPPPPGNYGTDCN